MRRLIALAFAALSLALAPLAARAQLLSLPAGFVFGAATACDSSGTLCLQLQNAAANVFTVDKSGNTTLASAAALSWNNDTKLFRDGAANILAQRNGTTAQIKRVYNTFTDASNGEWFDIDWASSANVARFGTNKNGAGTARAVRLIVGGNGEYDITTAGHITPNNNITQDLGANGTAMRDVWVGRRLATAVTGATAPAISSCGSSPSTSTGSTDFAGEVTTGSSAVTACTITFAATFTNQPACIVVDRSTLANLTSYTVSTSAIVLTLASSTSVKIVYACIGA